MFSFSFEKKKKHYKKNYFSEIKKKLANVFKLGPILDEM